MTKVDEHRVQAGSIFDGYLYDKLIAPWPFGSKT